jgi:1-acyl-sn-glycerol-3-phosphate acyltransferase
MRAMVQALRTPLVASAFFFFWGGAVILSWLVCPLLVVAVPDRIRRRRICQGIARRAFRLFHGYMRALRLMRLEVVGAHAERPAGAFVMVSNHPTLVDATAILANYDALCCVVKTSLIRNFFVGRFLRFCGHIDGGNGEVMSGAATLHEAQKRLEDGDGVLIFPEGTRSPRRGMSGFRRGAFELATRARVPLWPMFISCEPPALSRGVPIWKHPDSAARQKLTPQPLMVPSPSTSSRGLCRGVETTCRRWLVDRGLADLPDQGVAPALTVDEARPSGYKLPSMAMEWEEQVDDPR